MEKGIIYPKDYVETAKPSDDPEGAYAVHREGLITLVKSLVTIPIAREELVKRMAKAKAKGTTDHWGRAIDEVNLEWHPELAVAPKEVEPKVK